MTEDIKRLHARIAELESAIAEMAHGAVMVSEALVYLKMNGLVQRDHPMVQDMTKGVSRANLAFRSLYQTPIISHHIIEQLCQSDDR